MLVIIIDTSCMLTIYLPFDLCTCILVQEGDEVLFESYASIKHILTGQWLHLEKRGKHARIELIH